MLCLWTRLLCSPQKALPPDPGLHHDPSLSLVVLPDKKSTAYIPGDLRLTGGNELALVALELVTYPAGKSTLKRSGSEFQIRLI